MATETDIVNQGLLLLGASQIGSLSESSPNAIAANLIYADTRDALIRTYMWKFAIRRVQLNASGTPPIFGRSNAYDLPSDYLALLPPYPEDNLEQLDWIVENGQIVTDCSEPLDVRYIAQVTDTTKFDPLFRKALSAALALELAEQITQSNTKIANISTIFSNVVRDARQQNAFEQVNHLPPLDEWITVRQRGRDNTKTWHG